MSRASASAGLMPIAAHPSLSALLLKMLLQLDFLLMGFSGILPGPSQFIFRGERFFQRIVVTESLEPGAARPSVVFLHTLLEVGRVGFETSLLKRQLLLSGFQVCLRPSKLLDLSMVLCACRA